ncbi:unnamed protein product, partial [marine sediment metagenome]
YDSFWDTENSGLGGSSGGEGKPTSEMKNVATYTNTTTEGLNEPWDFVGNPNDDIGNANLWKIDGAVNDGYPFIYLPSDTTPPAAFGLVSPSNVSIYDYDNTMTFEWLASTDAGAGLNHYTIWMDGSIIHNVEASSSSHTITVPSWGSHNWY